MSSFARFVFVFVFVIFGEAICTVAFCISTFGEALSTVVVFVFLAEP